MKRIIIDQFYSFDVSDSEFSLINSFLSWLYLCGLFDYSYSVCDIDDSGKEVI